MTYLACAAINVIIVAGICGGEKRAAAVWMDQWRRKRAAR